MNERTRLLAEAREAEASGNRGALTASLRALVTLFPDDVLGRTWLGAHLLEGGDVAGAFEHLEMARTLVGDDPSVLALWSVAARGVGRADVAVQVLREAARANPSATLLVLLADVLHEIGLDDESTTALETAVSLEPSNEEALYNLAVARKRTDPGTAVELLEKAIAVDSSYAEAFRELAFCLMVMNRWAEAEAPLSEAARLAPHDLWTAVYRSILDIQAGRLPAAQERLGDLIDRTEMSLVPRLLGDVAKLREDHEGAREFYIMAASRDPHERRNLELVNQVADADLDAHWIELLKGLRANDTELERAARRADS